jgi:hypothetical protein
MRAPNSPILLSFLIFHLLSTIGANGNGDGGALHGHALALLYRKEV